MKIKIAVFQMEVSDCIAENLRKMKSAFRQRRILSLAGMDKSYEFLWINKIYVKKRVFSR